MKTNERKLTMPDELKKCVEFHGHICPGLIYGYRVAREAIKIMKLKRAGDEEVVAVCENDSCAVDALQVLLGTAAGKGNLIIRDFGKNAYTVLSRSRRQAWRFSRRTSYEYKGQNKNLFDRLEAAVAAGTATENERRKLKRMKIDDLLARPFEEIFTAVEVPFAEPDYAQIQPSAPCVLCGEMTMATKMMKLSDGRQICIPCAQKNSPG